MNRPVRALLAVGVLAAAVTGTVLAVKASNGDFSGEYRLTGYFPAAGEGLEPGSEVVYRGVQVGRVGSISLAGTAARVTLLIDHGFAVPTDTSASIQLVNLFGAEQVSLRFPSGRRGPDLSPGATLARTSTGDELGTLFQAAAPLLQDITTKSLASVIGDLAQASDGEGPGIRHSLEAGASLAAYLDETLTAQIKALDSFSSFTAAVADDGSSLNGLSAAENVALPAFNQDAADYTRLLDALSKFSTRLAALLSDYHPTLVTLLSDGANPARVLTAQKTELGQVIAGLYHYGYKVGTSRSAGALPDGSHFVYFSSFILFTDINNLVCDLLAPPEPGLSYLEPLQQALTGAGSALTCKSQLATFDSLQSATPAAAPAPATPTAPASVPATAPVPATPSNPLTAAEKALGTAVYGIVGLPATTTQGSLSTYLGALLGGHL